MESSSERLATICVDYRETFWMRRNAPRENNFARGYCRFTGVSFILIFGNLVRVIIA